MGRGACAQGMDKMLQSGDGDVTISTRAAQCVCRVCGRVGDVKKRRREEKGRESIPEVESPRREENPREENPREEKRREENEFPM